MRTEMHTFKVSCDNCHDAVMVSSNSSYGCSLPEGWTSGATHDCGLTGYTRWDDLCPKCKGDSK